MPAHSNRPGRLNIKALVILAVVGVVLVGGAFVARKVQKRAVAQAALTQGNAAYERGDWQAARTMLGRWLARNPHDAEINDRFAHAQLAGRPVLPENIGLAINAYRRFLRTNPADTAAFRRVALLYESIGDFGELEHVARKRLEVVPGDPDARLEIAKSLVYRQELDDARATLQKLVEGLDRADSPTRQIIEACVLLSALPPQGSNEAPEDWSLRWLDYALTLEPDSSWALVHRAALRRELGQRTPDEGGRELLAVARADLEQAEELQPDDPRVRLLLAEQWMLLWELDRAAAQIDAARRLDADTVQKYIIDPNAWTVALFMHAGRLSLAADTRAGGVELAQNALQELERHPHRLQIAPLAIELLVAGEHAADAHALLDDYLERLEVRGTAARNAETTALLRAIVADAEDQPYEVIKQLAPLVERPDFPPRACSLLAQAYARTAQPAQQIRVLSGSGPAQAPELVLMLARALVQQGRWVEARAALRPFATSHAGNLDANVLGLSADVGLALTQSEPVAPDALDNLAEELRALRDAHPQRTDVRLLLATLAEKRSGPEAALSELEAARAACGESLDIALAQAALMAGAGWLDDAVTGLEAACTRHPGAASAWSALADLLVRQGRIDEAREQLDKAREQATDPEQQRRIAIRRAALEIIHGDRQAGIDELEQLAADNPLDVGVRTMLLGVLDVGGDDRAAAARLVGEIATIEGADTVVIDGPEIKQIEGASGLLWRLHLARHWLAGERWSARQARIEKLLQHCIAVDPRGVMPALMLGEMYERLGRQEEAESTYRAGFEHSDASELGLRWLRMLQARQDFSQAREVYQRLSEKFDEQARSALLVHQAIGEGRYDQAIKELELRVAGSGPGGADLVLLARLKYVQNREVDRALELLDQAAAQGAAPLDLARVRADILRQEDRLDEAQACLDELVSAHPTSEAYLLRAAYHSAVGHPQLAEQDYITLARQSEDAYGYRALADFYAQANDLDAAIDAAEEGVARHPDEHLLKRGLAGALLARGGAGDRSRARELLAELEQALPGDAGVLQMRAALLLEQDTPESREQARSLLRNAVGAPEAPADTYRSLAKLAVRTDDYATAQELVRRGLKAHPDDLDLQALAGEVAFLLGDFEVALRHADAVLASPALNAERQVSAVGIIVDTAVARNDLAALRHQLPGIQELAAANPAYEGLQLLLARAHTALGDVNPAIETLEQYRAAQADRESLHVLLLLEELYRSAGDFDAAQQRLDAAATLAPDDPAVLQSRLMLLAAQERFDNLVQLVTQQPENKQRPDTLMLAAWILQSSPDHRADAIRLCERAIAIDPDHLAARAGLALLLYQSGDGPAAKEMYEQLLQRDPDHAEALNNLAWIMATEDEAYETALAYAQRAVALRPDDPNFRDTLGTILRSAGRGSEARSEFRQGARLAPEGSSLRATLLLHLSQVCAELNDWGPIAGYLRETLEIDHSGTALSPEDRAEAERLVRAARARTG